MEREVGLLKGGNAEVVLRSAGGCSERIAKQGKSLG